MALRDYIANTLKNLHTKNQIDWLEEADIVMEQILDPNWNPPAVHAKKNATKCESYAQFQAEYPSAIHNKIYNYLLNSPEPLSRQELADDLNLRLATVCGRCKELIDSEVIVVHSKIHNEDTNRMVEILTIVKLK